MYFYKLNIINVLCLLSHVVSISHVAQALLACNSSRRIYSDSRYPSDVASSVGGWLRLAFGKLYPLAECPEKMRRACCSAIKTIDHT